ncbi:hypothetical protein J6590_016567 [Homalodisca vitripennis]|nr:hypothetical protein J6590_016567 [Homalodisca vitripennis]
MLIFVNCTPRHSLRFSQAIVSRSRSFVKHASDSSTPPPEFPWPFTYVLWGVREDSHDHSITIDQIRNHREEQEQREQQRIVTTEEAPPRATAAPPWNKEARPTMILMLTF